MIITLPQAAKLSFEGRGGPIQFSYPYLAQCARTKKFKAQKAGGIYITTKKAIQDAVDAGEMGQRSKNS